MGAFEVYFKEMEAPPFDCIDARRVFAEMLDVLRGFKIVANDGLDRYPGWLLSDVDAPADRAALLAARDWYVDCVERGELIGFPPSREQQRA